MVKWQNYGMLFALLGVRGVLMLALLVTLAPFMSQATIPGASGTLRRSPLMQLGVGGWGAGMRARGKQRLGRATRHTRVPLVVVWDGLGVINEPHAVLLHPEFGVSAGGSGYYPQPYSYYYTGPWYRDGCYGLPDGPLRWQCWQRQRNWGRQYFGARGYYYYPVINDPS